MTELRFAIRVRPGARRNAVGGHRPGPRGAALLVSVTAPAVDGKANEAVRRVLAAALDLRRAQLDIVAGDRGRDKVVRVTDAPAGLADRIAALTGETGSGPDSGHNGPDRR